MSTGSKVVLLLSFVFIGVLVWYYGPSSTSTDQIAQDPVLQQSTPVPAVSPLAARPPAPVSRTTTATIATSNESPAVSPLTPPLGPQPRQTTGISNAPSYLVMGQPVPTAAFPAPVSPATARLRSDSTTKPARASSATATSVETSSRTVQANPVVAVRTHVVRAGDTLSSISETFYGSEVDWIRIADANPEVDPDRLRIGTPLKIPAYAPRASRLARSGGPTTVSRAAAPGTRSHRVEDGESLSSIADRYYGRETQWTRIFEANREMLKGDPDRLRIGMVLAIPGK